MSGAAIVPTDDAMLDAHVQFELGRLTGEGLEQTVRDEVGALFEWLGGVTLAEVADPQTVTSVAVTSARSITGDEMAQHLCDVMVTARGTLVEASETVAEVLDRDQAGEWARAVAGMDKARNALMEQVTTSKAYTRLVAHVVYHGVKSYLLTENVLAKRIPGASSLVRLGQRGIGAAAPNLEKNVDKQLIAFVDANIADTVHDSQRFLDAMLDDELVVTMAEQAWEAAAHRPIAGGADLVSDDDLATIAGLAWNQWLTLRETDFVDSLVGDAVTGFFAEHGDRPIAEVLAELGVDAETVIEAVLPLALPAAAHLADTGYLQERVQARLKAFYDTYDG
ncbi:MAG: hypothetical protein WCA29_08050 [Jiangellales bacterium]